MEKIEKRKEKKIEWNVNEFFTSRRISPKVKRSQTYWISYQLTSRSIHISIESSDWKLISFQFYWKLSLKKNRRGYKEREWNENIWDFTLNNLIITEYFCIRRQQKKTEWVCRWMVSGQRRRRKENETETENELGKNLQSVFQYHIREGIHSHLRFFLRRWRVKRVCSFHFYTKKNKNYRGTWEN